MTCDLLTGLLGISEKALIEVIGVQDGTVKTNFALFTGAIDSCAKQAKNVRISKDKRFNAAQQAEEILEVMLEDMESLKAGNLTSRRRGASLVAPFNGETSGYAIYHQLQHSITHCSFFSACMNAYARCGAPDAALKAESILQRLLADFTEGRSSIHPDTSTCHVTEFLACCHSLILKN